MVVQPRLIYAIVGTFGGKRLDSSIDVRHHDVPVISVVLSHTVTRIILTTKRNWETPLPIGMDL